MSTNPNNLEIDVTVNIMIITVDLARVVGTTANGRRARIASSHNCSYGQFHIGLNITRPFAAAEMQSLAAGSIPAGWGK